MISQPKTAVAPVILCVFQCHYSFRRIKFPLTQPQFLVLSLGEAREATSTIYRTLNPEWNQTLELPIVGLQSAILDAVCWDKDRFGKDYMGEFQIELEDLFSDGKVEQEVRPTHNHHCPLLMHSPYSPDGTHSPPRSPTARKIAMSPALSSSNFPCLTNPPHPPTPRPSFRS